MNKKIAGTVLTLSFIGLMVLAMPVGAQSEPPPWEVPTTVLIDIKPWSFPNSFSLNDQGLLPVAILGNGTFDVNDIYPETVQIGGVSLAYRGSAKAPRLACSYEDVNEDGFMDLIVFFDIQTMVDLGVLTETTTSLTLTAGLISMPMSIQGMDSVNIVSS